MDDESSWGKDYKNESHTSKQASSGASVRKKLGFKTKKKRNTNNIYKTVFD